MDEKKVREALKLLTELKYGYAYSEEAKGLLEQALAPKPTLYKGQQVLVSDDKVFWKYGIFVSTANPYSDGFKYGITTDSPSSSTKVIFYQYCKPDPSAITRPVWQLAVAVAPIIPPNHQIVWTVNEDYYAFIPSPEWL